LKPPYSYVINGSFERSIPGNMTFAIGYTGRLSHRLLLQGDVYTPLEYFKESKSGITWEQNNAAVRALYDAGYAAAVQKNPSLVPALPFVENLSRVERRRFSWKRVGELFSVCFTATTTEATWIVSRSGPQHDEFIPSRQMSDRYRCYTFFPIQCRPSPDARRGIIDGERGLASFHG